MQVIWLEQVLANHKMCATDVIFSGLLKAYFDPSWKLSPK
jgi:hypothetical protein